MKSIIPTFSWMPSMGLVDQAALVVAQQLVSVFHFLAVGLLPGHQHALPEGGDDLHHVDAGTGRTARGGLNGQARHPRHLQRAGQVVIPATTWSCGCRCGSGRRAVFAGCGKRCGHRRSRNPLFLIITGRLGSRLRLSAIPVRLDISSR